MPTYQYACTECGHEFEAVQKFSDSALTECPNCAGKLRKVFSAVGVVFKGSGFYRTDSRESAKSGAKSGAQSDGKSGKSGSSSTESSGGSSGTSSAGESSSSSSTTTAPSSPSKSGGESAA